MGAANSRSRLSGEGSRITLSNDIPNRNSSDDTTTVYFTENAINLLNTSFGPAASDATNSCECPPAPGSSTWSQQNNAQMNQVLFDRVTSIAYQQGLLDAEKSVQRKLTDERAVWSREKESLLSQREKWSEELVNKFTSDLHDDLERTSKKFSTINTEVACENEQNDLMKCYVRNSKQPLNCESIVKQYADCVETKQREMKSPGSSSR